MFAENVSTLDLTGSSIVFILSFYFIFALTSVIRLFRGKICWSVKNNKERQEKFVTRTSLLLRKSFITIRKF